MIVLPTASSRLIKGAKSRSPETMIIMSGEGLMATRLRQSNINCLSALFLSLEFTRFTRYQALAW